MSCDDNNEKAPSQAAATEGTNSNEGQNGNEKRQDERESDGEGPGEGDLVMRDGFPALRIPGTKGKPMVDGEEPIPRHLFWSSQDAIAFDSTQLDLLRQDCATVFTARDKPDGQAYSTGQTFFLPANKEPRCALEALVMTIFQKHTAHLEKGTFSPAHSGAEWWTLVMDDDDDDADAPPSGDTSEEEEEDEVGLHFDADYELEDQASNLLLHPRLATVTYLSNYGAPTLILNQKSPPMEDIKKKTLEQGIDKAWLSHPHVGKHTAFDGRLLHGAPALFFPSKKQLAEKEQPDAKRQKVDTKRYTLLVNIWLNHWVLDAALLDEEICSSLKTPWEPPKSNLKSDDTYVAPFTWNDNVDLNQSPKVEKITLKPSNVDPAGEDEIALCNHEVTVKYNPLMQECHKASASGSNVEMELVDGAITIEVGEELKEEEESGDEEEVEG